MGQLICLTGFSPLEHLQTLALNGGVQSLVGKLLLASQSLLDPNFVKTVVLIVRHDEDGAFGLVVNRPAKITVADAIGGNVEAAAECREPIYFGGPCQGPVFIVHTDHSIGGDEPFDGVFTTTDREAIETIIQSESTQFKLFASYSGWGAGQLENELKEGGWLVCDAHRGDIFAEDAPLWTRLISRVNLTRFVDPEKIPEDPSSN